MADERQSPDAVLASAELSGGVGDIDDDPDSPDGNWMVASGNNVNVDVRTSFPTPTGSPTVGADLQEFKAWVRQYDEGQGGTPEVRIELWENGNLVRAGNDENVTTSGHMVSFTWNANELGTADGSLVEMKVVGTKAGGSPSNRNTIDVGAVEWNVAYTAGVTTHYETLPATAIGVGALATTSSYYRTLAPVAVGVPSLSRTNSFYRALPATAIASPLMSKGMYVAIDATAIGVAVLSTAKMFSKALDAVALGVATLSRVTTYQQIISATAIGVSVLTKVATHYLTLVASATGTPQLLKGMAKTLSATAVGTAVLSEVLIASRTLGAVAQGIAGIVTQFIGGAISVIKRFSRFTRWS